MAQRAQRLGIDLRFPALYEEIGKPGVNKLYLAAKERSIPLSQAKAREFTRTDERAQTYGPAPSVGGKVVSSSVNDRGAADLIDQQANRGAGGESAILVVQYRFSRRIFAGALQRQKAILRFLRHVRASWTQQARPRS